MRVSFCKCWLLAVSPIFSLINLPFAITDLRQRKASTTYSMRSFTQGNEKQQPLKKVSSSTLQMDGDTSLKSLINGLPVKRRDEIGTFILLSLIKVCVSPHCTAFSSTEHISF